MTISFASLAGGKYQRTEIITSTQNWICPAGVTTAQVFLVGGGGGGGNYDGGNCGGGGGGGVVERSVSVTPGNSYTVTIGAGGSGGAIGSASTFGSLITAYGGGFGVYNNCPSSTTLAASGGGARDSYRGGGGGGASTIFGIYNGYNSYSINYYPVVQGTFGYPPNSYMANPGVNGYGAGGGGGSNQENNSGRGGANAGDGGNNAAGTAATNGVANFGGGGGGASTSYNSGSGGSGVCIIKYWA